MPLKILGAGMLCVSGFFAGYFKASRLRARSVFLKELISFLTALATEIRYDGSDIFTLVSRSSTLFNIPNTNYNQSFNEAWKITVAPFKRKYALTQQDMKLLYELGEGLGKTDYQGQFSHIGLYRTLAEKQLQNSEEEIKNKSKVYRALGIFAGSSLAVVLF